MCEKSITLKSITAVTETISEKRVVKLTPKALLDRTGQLKKERKSTFGKLSKTKKSITKLIGDKQHVNEVQHAFNMYKELCDKTKQVHTSLLGLLPAYEAEKHEIWYKSNMLNVNEFIAVTSQWLSDTKGCPATKHDDDDDNGHIETQIEQKLRLKWSVTILQRMLELFNLKLLMSI